MRPRMNLDEYFRVMARWRLSESQQRQLLGGLSSDTYTRLAAGYDVDSVVGLRERIGTIVAIDRAAARKLGHPDTVSQWLWMANSEHPFRGAPPLALMLGERAGLSIVANYFKREAG